MIAISSNTNWIGETVCIMEAKGIRNLRGSATTAEATSKRAINFCHIFSAQIDLEANDDSIQLPLTYWLSDWLTDLWLRSAAAARKYIPGLVVDCCGVDSGKPNWRQELFMRSKHKQTTRRSGEKKNNSNRKRDDWFSRVFISKDFDGATDVVVLYIYCADERYILIIASKFIASSFRNASCSWRTLKKEIILRLMMASQGGSQLGFRVYEEWNSLRAR